jgi:hypothetical protein
MFGRQPKIAAILRIRLAQLHWCLWPFTFSLSLHYWLAARMLQISSLNELRFSITYFCELRCCGRRELTQTPQFCIQVIANLSVLDNKASLAFAVGKRSVHCGDTTRLAVLGRTNVTRADDIVVAACLGTYLRIAQRVAWYHCATHRPHLFACVIADRFNGLELVLLHQHLLVVRIAGLLADCA